MNLFAQIECLTTSGAISESEKSSLLQVAKNLPTTTSELLGLIAAKLLTGNYESFQPIGTESIISSDYSDQKSLTIPSGATRCIITAFDNNVIFRLDATPAAPGSARILLENETAKISALNEFIFASQSGTDAATIFVEYY